MSRCADCAYWKLGLRKIFRDASFEARFADSGGRCTGPGFMGGQVVPDNFGCVDFTPGESHWLADDHSEKEPWQVWDDVSCPDCRGVGSEKDAACYRCAGTGHVRQYGDGWVGEEQTRLHPVEAEFVRREREAAVLARAHAEIARLGQPSAAIVKDEKLPFAT